MKFIRLNSTFRTLHSAICIKMKPSYIHIFALMTVFVAPIFSEDRFGKLFQAKAPLKEVMSEIMSIDPITNYRHFQTVLDHIKKNDEYSPYAKTLVTATQKVLDHVLSEIGYNEKMDVSKFIDIAYGVVTGTSLPDVEMMNLLMKVNKYAKQVYEEAAQQVKKNVMEKLMGVVEGSKGKTAGRRVRRNKTKPTSKDN